MRSDTRLVSIQHLDTKQFERIAWSKADDLVSAGKAKFVSNSAYRKATRPKKQKLKKEIAAEQSAKAAERRKQKQEA